MDGSVEGMLKTMRSHPLLRRRPVVRSKLDIPLKLGLTLV